MTHVVCGMALLLLCLSFDCIDSQFARFSKSLQQQPDRCSKGQTSTLIYIVLLLSLTDVFFYLIIILLVSLNLLFKPVVFLSLHSSLLPQMCSSWLEH